MTNTAGLIPISDRAAWEGALEGLPYAFAHSWQSCHAMWLTSGAPTQLFHWADGESRFVCPLIERRYAGYTDVCTPYGFSGFCGRGDWIGMLAAWRGLAAERGYVCGYIGLNPLLATAEHFPEGELFEYNDIYVLDLRRSEAEMHAALSSNRKRQLRALASDTPELNVTTEDCRDFLSANLNAFYEQKGAGSVYRLTEGTLRMLMQPQHSVIVGASDSSGVSAASLFVYSSHIAEYFAGISTAEGREWSAILLWRGAMELKRLGIPFLNLGGGVRRGDGIADFKLRFGATPYPLCALKQVYRPDVYRRLCELAGADPERVDGYFPAYHVARASGVGSAAPPVSGDATTRQL